MTALRCAVMILTAALFSSAYQEFKTFGVRVDVASGVYVPASGVWHSRLAIATLASVAVSC
jgi:hypothetical protein